MLRVAGQSASVNLDLRPLTRFHHHASQGIPFILVGTKLDLRDDQDAVKRLAERRQTPISFSEAQGLASDLDAYRYLECSALTQHGLKQVMM